MKARYIISLLTVLMMSLVSVNGATAATVPTTTPNATMQKGTPISPKQVMKVTGTTLSATSAVCWFRGWNHQWGSQPFDQILEDRTYWCANSAETLVTYRSTTVGQAQDTCQAKGAYQYRLAGAANGTTYYIEWDDVGNWTCPFPYVGWSAQDQMALYATSYGTYTMYWHN